VAVEDSTEFPDCRIWGPSPFPARLFTPFRPLTPVFFGFRKTSTYCVSPVLCASVSSLALTHRKPSREHRGEDTLTHWHGKGHETPARYALLPCFHASMQIPRSFHPSDLCLGVSANQEGWAELPTTDPDMDSIVFVFCL
jgi:hypothetical protein